MRFFSFLIIFSVYPALMASLSFSSGPWDLSVAKKNGAWQSLKFKGTELLANPHGEQTLNLNAAVLKASRDFEDHSAGEAGGVAALEAAMTEGEKESPVTLTSHHFDPEKRLLTLQYTFGNWELAEEVEFGAAGCENRICRKARFKSAAAKDLKFRNFRFTLFFPLTGEYFFPATFLTDTRWREDNRPDYPEMRWENRKGNVTELSCSGNDRVKFSILSPKPELSLIVFIDSRLDGANVYYRRNRDNLQTDWRFGAQGWALPGKEQQLAGAYLEVAEKDSDRAMRENCPQMLRDLGFTVPADRPQWVQDAAIYGLVMDPFHQMRVTNVPEHSMPRMRQLGLNTAWYQPMNAATARYDVLDYTVIDPKLGTWDDYRNANELMHKNNMRVLQDIVPHGGGQVGFLIRGQSAMMMAFTESGDVLNSWSADFNNPAWKKYMADVSEFYTGDLKTDGFRIDAIYGSKPLRNWRKAGFPAGIPGIRDFNNMSRPASKKMLPALWKQTMEIEGGKVPALEYDRASLASSYAGISMSDYMRKGSRKGNPDSAVLLESAELPFTACGDMHYDRDIQSLWFKLRALTPENFVKGLTAWLDEQQYIDAPGTIRMRYMETGQVESWPYRRWYGFEGDKAIRALCAYIHGVPMVQEVFTEGSGVYLNKVLTIRREMESLRRGKADYRAVKSSVPSVFTVLRSTDKEQTAAVINFSPEKVTAKLDVPFKGVVYDLYSGSRLSVESGKVELILPPFGNAVLAAMPELPQWVTWAKAPQINKITGKAPEISETAKEITVVTGAYTVTVDKASGMINSFGAKDSPVKVIEDIFVRTAPVTGKACVSWEKSPSGNITVRAQKGDITLLYSAMPNRLNVSASGTAGRLLGLSFPGAVQWELDSFEGMLADFMPENPEPRKCSIIPFVNKQRIMMDYTILWASADRPWDWNRRELRVFGRNAGGITLDMQQEAGGQYLYQAFENRTALQFLAKFGGNDGVLCFSLLPDAVHKKSVFGKQVKIGDNLTLTNESYGWKIENPSYVMHILRSNGVIRELYAKKDGKLIPVLEKQNLTAGRTMFTNMPYAAASMDPESMVKLNYKDGILSMTFIGELRSAYTIPLKDRMRLTTSYTFDDTPEIGIEYTFRNSAVRQARPDVVFSARQERFTKYLKWSAAASDNAGKVVRESKGRNLKFRFFDGLELLKPRTDYKVALALRTDGQPCQSLFDLTVANPVTLRLDSGFEERCSMVSEKDGRRVLNFNFEYDESLPWYIHFATYAAPGIGRDGSAGVFMTWANPTFIQELNPAEFAKGRYQLSIDVKGDQLKNPDAKTWCEKLNKVHPFLNEYTPFAIHVDYYTKDGRKKSVTRNWRLGKVYDWKTLQVTFNLDEDAYAPSVRVEAMPEYIGQIYLDNLKFEKLK